MPPALISRMPLLRQRRRRTFLPADAWLPLSGFALMFERRRHRFDAARISLVTIADAGVTPLSPPCRRRPTPSCRCCCYVLLRMPRFRCTRNIAMPASPFFFALKRAAAAIHAAFLVFAAADIFAISI
jgi:hypothetical protein